MAEDDTGRQEEGTADVCLKCGSAMVSRAGRYGKFLACSAYPQCRSTRPIADGDGGAAGAPEDVPHAPCPKDGEVMVLKKGRFGPFLACTRYPECRETRALVRGPGGKLEVEVQAPIEDKCPVCGSDLTWRRGRFGAFTACASYPTCKYVKKKEGKEVGLLCPDCHQAPVVERTGRWGRSFYGCRRYPECRFTAYHRPIPEPCPDCARPYLLEKETKKEGKVVFCGNEECHFKRQAA
jgi:DNA topoisomerase I